MSSRPSFGGYIEWRPVLFGLVRGSGDRRGKGGGVGLGPLRRLDGLDRHTFEGTEICAGARSSSHQKTAIFA